MSPSIRIRASHAAAIAAAATIGLAACASPPSTGASATGPSQPPAPLSCAWPTMLGVRASNVAAPDSAATYWLQPITANADTRIVVTGRFADARYISLSVYTPSLGPFTTNGVGSTLTDYRIAPDRGSRNPWQRQAAPGGRFTVTVRPDVSTSQTNVLPMPQGTTSEHPGYLLYRVYLPTGDPTRMPLPTLTVQEGRTSRVLPTCKDHNAPIPARVTTQTTTPPTTTPAAPLPPQLEFYKLAQSTADAGAPNTDSAYVLAYLIRPQASDVVVVTGKAPTSARGTHPSPWPVPGEDMRYWSMCVQAGSRQLPTVVNTLPDGRTDYGCRADDQTALDAAGDYTYVLGTEAQRAAIERVPGVTFLPFATDQTTPLYVLFLRNMLVNPAFPNAVQNVTQGTDPAAAAAAMGPYYPHARVCPLATLTAGGPKSCP